ncbi:MAG: SprT family zinc-dependent metalloprotease [Alphaproteobacteria bacterium]|nr:SprT family zinc-dependent metalloprotease [Alphaproteobacteria bacterium]
MTFLRRPPPDIPAYIAGVRIKLSARAKRMSLRVDSRTGEVLLSLPRRTSVRRAEKFIMESHDWIEKQRAKNSLLPDVVDGAVIGILGRDYVVTHRSGRGLPRIEDGQVIVHGDPAHLVRRLRDFLKKEAKRVLPPIVTEKARQADVTIKNIRIIDPKTRWGSCGPDGQIMLSWRLLLAPVYVADYLAAHEVAHRVHMNHSKKFWRLCDSLCENGPAARDWLTVHGDQLMRLYQPSVIR